MNLLPLESLITTGPVDHADWSYRPLLSIVQRLRFRLVLALIGKRHCRRLLEIGYGSGIFLPELRRRCDELHGIDIHNHQNAVTEILAKHGVDATLVSGGAESLPFDDASLDCVVAISALEFVTNLDRVCAEVKRVLAPTGSFIVVTPGRSAVLDFGLKLLTGASAKDDFADRRATVLPAIERHFTIDRMIAVPVGGSLFCLYRALRCVPRESAGRS